MFEHLAGRWLFVQLSGPEGQEVEAVWCKLADPISVDDYWMALTHLIPEDSPGKAIPYTIVPRRRILGIAVVPQSRVEDLKLDETEVLI